MRVGKSNKGGNQDVRLAVRQIFEDEPVHVTLIRVSWKKQLNPVDAASVRIRDSVYDLMSCPDVHFPSCSCGTAGNLPEISNGFFGVSMTESQYIS